MLTQLPNFYENELLYSVFARYHIRSGNDKPIQTLRDLFGSRHIRPYPHIPRKTENVYEQYKHLNLPPIDEWIINHTMFYYYSNFSREKEKENLYQLMIKGTANSIVKNVTLHSNKYFKYCPKCVEEDYERYGETYWRRDHQLYGIFFCLKHKEFLIDSTLLWHPFYKGEGSLAFEAASTENCIVNIESTLDISENDKNIIINIAKQMSFLANNRLPISYEETSRIYRYLLHREGYMIGDRVNSQKLFSDFRKKYSETILNLLEANFDHEKRSNWLSLMVKKHNQVFSPIKHILLILLLKEDLSSFYLYNHKEDEYFPGSPYHCLNPFSDHYMQRVIEEVNIIHCRKIKSQIGLFNCKCGFSFTRIPKTELKVYQIKSASDWEPFFEKLISSDDYKLEKLDQEEIDNLKQKYLHYKIGRKNSHPKKIVVKEYREKWLALMDKYPDFSTDKLRTLDMKLYVYLYRHDKDWLRKNTPTVINVGRKSVNWIERDKILLNEIKEAKRIILNKGKPERITLYSIRREIQQPNQLTIKTLKKLPETKEYIDSITETIEQFQIRRVNFCYDLLLKENKPVNEYNLKKLAGLPNECNIAVQNKIEELLGISFISK